MEINDKFARNFTIFAGSLLFLASAVSYALFSVSSDFPSETIVAVEKGWNLSEASARLFETRVVRFPLIFKVLVFFGAGEKNIKAGNYFFEKPLSLFAIYSRLTGGVYGLAPAKITVVEGWSALQIGKFFEKKGFFSLDGWMREAQKEEGYLFPDTYFIQPDAEPAAIVKQMRENFDKKITPEIADEINRQKKSLKDIIIMASIIEKEMSSPDDGRVISGILWKRFEAGMGLQADATVSYLVSKPSLQLSADDLAVDSPYNTYKYRGLPPAPISNPGLEAIRAAVFPKKTPYWYYLHDSKGKSYYAATFDEHVANKLKYLR